MSRIKKTRIMTTRELTIWGINNDRSNAEVVALVLKKHPHSQITAATVNWTRNQVRRKNKAIKSDRVTRRSR